MSVSAPSMTPERRCAGTPLSPCISLCALDAEGYCSGCLRTREEIGAWIAMTASQQSQLLSELDRRRAARAAAKPR